MAGTVSVRHKFVSQFEDSEEAAASGELLPSDWNDEHEVVGAAPIDSPAFLNTPTAPTPPKGDGSQRLATMAAIQAATAPPTRRTLIEPGDYSVEDGIGLVVVKKTVPALTTISLPLSPHPAAAEVISVKDRMLANGAGAGSFNITVSASGDELIDGVGTIKLDVDNMALSFRKIRDDSGAISGEGWELV